MTFALNIAVFNDEYNVSTRICVPVFLSCVLNWHIPMELLLGKDLWVTEVTYFLAVGQQDPRGR